jgi:hypothetical protein
MSAGRPKKTLEDLPEGWREDMKRLASEGASDIEIRVALGCISDDLWYRFIEEEPEFSRAVQECRLLCQTWWEKTGRLHLVTEKGESFNNGVYALHMKNRFGWREKQEVENKGGLTLNMNSEAANSAI